MHIQAQHAAPPASAAATEDERAVLHDLASGKTYDQIRVERGWSRGRTYQLALRHNARKTEARIAERHAERHARQVETLRELVGTTAKADVLDFMDSLPDECAQLCVTSTPYNVSKAYGGSPSADSMRHVFFVGWLMQVVSEAARILRPSGVLCLQVGSTKDDAGQLVPMDILLYEPIRKTGLTFQSRVIWTIGHGLTPKRRLSERHETMLVFSKGPDHTFNPTPARVPQKEPGKRAFKGANQGKLSGNPFGAHPSNVWDVANVGHNHPEKTGHPCQFPMALVKRAIMLYTMPGDLCIDPFNGSGTTQAACVESGRAFCGADLFYEDMRAKRLGGIVPDAVTLLPGVTDESSAIWRAEARRIDVPLPGQGSLFG